MGVSAFVWLEGSGGDGGFLSHYQAQMHEYQGPMVDIMDCARPRLALEATT